MNRYFILAVMQALLLVFQGVSYIVIQRFQGDFHDMMHPADYKIPLITKAVYIYGLWYPLIAVYPLYL